MRRIPWLVLLFAPMSCLCAHDGPPASIRHCVAADGTPVYTDQPCTRLDAAPVAAPVGAPGATAPASASDIGMPTPRGPQPCPASVDELKQRITLAFRDQDPNALAGLMLWRGWRSHGAVAQVRDLRSLVRRPLLGFGDASDAVYESPAFAGLPPLVPTYQPASRPGSITLRLGDTDGSHADRASFTLEPRQGCIWLQP